MRIDRAGRGDWALFRSLAAAEGWRVPAWELDLYDDGDFGEGYVLSVRGRVKGFVTVACHQRSGWIGNLLVVPSARGRGYGRRLFDHALMTLHRRGLDLVWLTASEQGVGLYRQHGFCEVDGIERWGRRSAGRLSAHAHPPVSPDEVIVLDNRAWQDNRERLLQRLARHGTCYRSGGSAAMLQQSGEFQVLGPWLSTSLCPRENRLLVSSALAALPPGSELVTDLLASSPVRSLLAAAGFSCLGMTRLMAWGQRPTDLFGLVSLASLGSLG